MLCLSSFLHTATGSKQVIKFRVTYKSKTGPSPSVLISFSIIVCLSPRFKCHFHIMPSILSHPQCAIIIEETACREIPVLIVEGILTSTNLIQSFGTSKFINNTPAYSKNSSALSHPSSYSHSSNILRTYADLVLKDSRTLWQLRSPHQWEKC